MMGFCPTALFYSYKKPLPSITPGFGKVCLYCLKSGDCCLIPMNTQRQAEVDFCLSREELMKEDFILTDALLADLTLESAEMKT